jgi:hypothetical protein
LVTKEWSDSLNGLKGSAKLVFIKINMPIISWKSRTFAPVLWEVKGL